MVVVTRRRLRVALAPHAQLDDDAAEDLGADPRVAVEDFGGGRWALHDAAGADHWALVDEKGRTPTGARLVEVVVGGWRFELEVDDAARAELVERATRAGEAATLGGPLEVRAIIPGRIMAVSIALGDTVALGQQLLVVEAMKMQNELRAPRAGTVEHLAAAVGATVDLGDVLVVIG